MYSNFLKFLWIKLFRKDHRNTTSFAFTKIANGNQQIKFWLFGVRIFHIGQNLHSCIFQILCSKFNRFNWLYVFSVFVGLACVCPRRGKKQPPTGKQVACATDFIFFCKFYVFGQYPFFSFIYCQYKYTH